MKQTRHNVSIKVHMKIYDDDEMEQTMTSHKGELFIKDGFEVLIYDEKINDEGKVRNLMTIKDGQVNLKRSGAISMNQKFSLHQSTQSLYQHPYGAFHMETFTEKINMDEEQEQKSLTIHYDIKLNGNKKQKHVLVLTYSKEDMT